jgi:MFS family permease
MFSHQGTVNAFGVFQTYYENNLLANKSPSDISWIGSIQAFLLLMIGVLTGPAYDAGYFRALITLGSFLIPFGFMMLSLCKEYWQVLLAQAFVIGLGNGCLFVPSVAILPQYFSTRKAVANGIAASGSSIGGVVYPIVFRQLYPRIGFPWTVRVMGFICLTTCAFSVCVMRPRIFPKHKRHLTDLAAFKEIPYTVFNIAMFFGFIGFYGPVEFSTLGQVVSLIVAGVLYRARSHQFRHYRREPWILFAPHPKCSVRGGKNHSEFRHRQSRTP